MVANLAVSPGRTEIYLIHASMMPRRFDCTARTCYEMRQSLVLVDRMCCDSLKELVTFCGGQKVPGTLEEYGVMSFLLRKIAMTSVVNLYGGVGVAIERMVVLTPVSYIQHVRFDKRGKHWVLLSSSGAQVLLVVKSRGRLRVLNWHQAFMVPGKATRSGNTERRRTQHA